MKIWLVWATNVWKSTLFNRLIGQFRAIVTDIPGTTTDIIQHKVQTDSATFTFFDSPGLLDFTDELDYIQEIIQNSDYLLFLIDDTVWITAKEQHILELIRKEKKQDSTLLIVNKLDVKRKESETEMAISDYYTLWLANVIWISAKHERNLSSIESQINALTLWGWGIPAVATFGCNVTSKQLNILNHSELHHVYIAYDGDEAGRKGTKKLIDKLSSYINVDVIKLPPGSDVNDLTEEEFSALDIVNSDVWLAQEGFKDEDEH